MTRSARLQIVCCLDSVAFHLPGLLDCTYHSRNMRLVCYGNLTSRISHTSKRTSFPSFESPGFRLTCRCFATQVHNREQTIHEEPQSIAIIGGGITGLTAAYCLSNAWPKSQVTIFDSSARFGGWIRSSKVEIDGGHIIFEHGPRTLRPSGGPQAELTLQLVRAWRIRSLFLLILLDTPTRLG